MQQEGADLIVGPLLKPEVIKTIELKSGLPVLALNEVDNIPLATTVCFFSLSPEDETRNAAQHLRQQQNLTHSLSFLTINSVKEWHKLLRMSGSVAGWNRLTTNFRLS